jgi:hypothetical protein
MPKHAWSEADDIVAFYLYRYETGSLKMSINTISKKLGMSETSLKMRIGNFKAIDGTGGLDNYARLSKDVYDKYKFVSEKDHLQKVQRILGIGS